MSGGNYGDGAETMEYQAKRIAENVMNYNGSAPCPTCGIVMNPVEFIANRGHCMSCLTESKLRKIKGKMA